MKKKNKLGLSLGVLLTAYMPLVAVVGCGKKHFLNSPNSNWISSSNNLAINLEEVSKVSVPWDMSQSALQQYVSITLKDGYTYTIYNDDALSFIQKYNEYSGSNLWIG